MQKFVGHLISIISSVRSLIPSTALHWLSQFSSVGDHKTGYTSLLIKTYYDRIVSSSIVCQATKPNVGRNGTWEYLIGSFPLSK